MGTTADYDHRNEALPKESIPSDTKYQAKERISLTLDCGNNTYFLGRNQISYDPKHPEKTNLLLLDAVLSMLSNKWATSNYSEIDFKTTPRVALDSLLRKAIESNVDEHNKSCRLHNSHLKQRQKLESQIEIMTQK